MVIAFSWVCEITPEGLKRGQEVDVEASISARTGQKISRITQILLALAILTMIAGQLIPEAKAEQADIDLQGHRGARGLLPENSIPAFLHALDLGVTTLEMDVAINAQGHLIVSHEPWMSAKICSHSNGIKVLEEEEKSLRIYAMSDAKVASFDCGRRGHPDFPDQKAMPVSKPLLSDVFTAVALHGEDTDRNTRFGQVLFNIEIKSRPEGDRIFHPEVREFASALYSVVKEHRIIEQTTIQSFDPRALEAMHKIDPQISIALLVDNQDGLQQNLSRISFTPQIYSPNYELLDQAQIDAAHAQYIKVIPWTVNDRETMRKLVKMGVDGLITDYPGLGIELLTEIQTNR